MIPINASSLYHQAVVYAHSSYFYFGGDGAESIIARLDGSSYKWNKVGQLKQGRYGHNAIHLNRNYFLVVGGWGLCPTVPDHVHGGVHDYRCGKHDFIRKTEKCKYKNNKMVCHLKYPRLKDYKVTPELMTVPDDYCDTHNVTEF